MSQVVILRGDAQRDLACKLIGKAPPNAVVKIAEERRTTQQSDKMWAMLSDIARARPMGRVLPSETWKALFLDDLGHKPKWEPSLDGDGVVNTGYRSSRLTKAAMSDMIERIYAFGAEHGVLWSEPK